jgi:hypothetical protein
MHLRRASYQRAESALRAVRSGPIPARRTMRSIKLAWCAMSANMLALRQKSLTGQSSCGPPMLPQADICRLPRTRDRRNMPGAQHPAARMPQSQVLSARVSGLAAHRQRGRIRGLVRDGSLWRHQALVNRSWPCCSPAIFLVDHSERNSLTQQRPRRKLSSVATGAATLKGSCRNSST